MRALIGRSAAAQRRRRSRRRAGPRCPRRCFRKVSWGPIAPGFSAWNVATLSPNMLTMPGSPCGNWVAVAAVIGAAVGCRDVTVDGFLASNALECPSGFQVSGGRCYRNAPISPPTGPPVGSMETPSNGDAGLGASVDSRTGATPDQRPAGPGQEPLPSSGDAAVPGPVDASSTGANPPPFEGSTVAIKLAGGASHDCAIMADETVRCWGQNDDGQTGQPRSPTRQQRATTVPGLREVVESRPARSTPVR